MDGQPTLLPVDDDNSFAPTTGDQGPNMQVPPKSAFPKAPKQEAQSQAPAQAQAPTPAATPPPQPDSPPTLLPVDDEPTDQKIKPLPAEPDTSAMNKYVSLNLKTNMPDAAPFQGQALADGTVPGTPRPAKTFVESLEAGLQMSIPGIVYEHGQQTIALPENADWAHRLAKNMGVFAGDAIPMLGGMVMGASAGAVGGSAVAGIPGAAAMAGVGTVSGAFAVPAAIRKMLIDHYQKGDIKDPGDFMQRLMATSWEAVKGGITGAAMGVVGPAAKYAYGTAASLTAELATMTSVGKFVEGHLPTLQDLEDNAAMLVGFHTLGHVAEKLGNIYAATGVKPADIVDQANENPALKQDLIDPDKTVPNGAESTELMHFTEKEGGMKYLVPQEWTWQKDANGDWQQVRSEAKLPETAPVNQMPEEGPNLDISNKQGLERLDRILSVPNDRIITDETQSKVDEVIAKVKEQAANDSGELPFVLKGLKDGEGVDKAAYNEIKQRLQDSGFTDVQDHKGETQGWTKPEQKAAELPEAKDQWELSPAKPDSESEDSGPTNTPARTEAEQRVLDTIVKRSKPGSAPLMDMLKKAKRSLTVALRNTLAPLGDIQKDAGNESLDPTQDAQKLAEIMQGGLSGKIYSYLAGKTFGFEDSAKVTGEGYFNILKQVPDKDYDMLDGVLKARRFLSDPKNREQGITREDAQELMDRNFKKFEPVIKMIDEYQQNLKQYAVDSGILSKGKSELFDKFENYAPLYKDLDVDPLTGKKDGSGGLFKKMEGSDKDSISSLQGILENTAAILRAGELNRVKQALVETPNLEEAGLARKLKGPVVGTPASNEIDVKYNGVTQRWAFDEETAGAIKSLNYSPQFSSLWAKIFAAPFKAATGALRLGTTGTIPFALFHGYRSEVASMIQSQHPGVPFLETLHTMGEMFGKHSNDFFQFLASGAGNISPGELSKAFEGKHWETESQSLLQQAKKYAWPDNNDNLAKKMWNLALSPFKGAEDFTGKLDTAPRLADFKRAGVEEGDPNKTTQAAYDARNLTVDYSKNGALIKLLSFGQPFLTVDSQGMWRATEALKDPKAWAKAAAIITLPEIVNFMINKDDPRYKNAASYKHGMAMVVPLNNWVSASQQEAEEAAKLGLARQNADGSYEVNKGHTLMIPRSFTLGLLFGSIPHMILSNYYNHNPHAFDELAKEVINTVAPAGIPTLAKGAFEQSYNINTFTRKPLIPDILQSQMPAYRFEPYTTEPAKVLGKLIGHLPQIGPDKAPLASPIVIENWVRDLTGNVGMTMLHAGDWLMKKYGVAPKDQSPEKDWDQSAMVSRFFDHFPSVKAQSVSDFESNLSQMNQQRATMQKLYQRANDRNNPDPSAYNDLVKIQASYNEPLHRQMLRCDEAIKTAKKSVYQIDKLPSKPDEKEQQIDTQLYRMMGIAEQANTIFNQANH